MRLGFQYIIKNKGIDSEKEYVPHPLLRNGASVDFVCLIAATLGRASWACGHVHKAKKTK